MNALDTMRMGGKVWAGEGGGESKVCRRRRGGNKVGGWAGEQSGWVNGWVSESGGLGKMHHCTPVWDTC